jgi:hypothetical protein
MCKRFFGMKDRNTVVAGGKKDGSRRRQDDRMSISGGNEQYSFFICLPQSQLYKIHVQGEGLAESGNSVRTIYMCRIDHLYPPPSFSGDMRGELYCIY